MAKTYRRSPIQRRTISYLSYVAPKNNAVLFTLLEVPQEIVRTYNNQTVVKYRLRIKKLDGHEMYLELSRTAFLEFHKLLLDFKAEKPTKGIVKFLQKIRLWKKQYINDPIAAKAVFELVVDQVNYTPKYQFKFIGVEQDLTV